MPQERLTMRKIREILRLKWECQLSERVVARRLPDPGVVRGRRRGQHRACRLAACCPEPGSRLLPDVDRSEMATGGELE